MSRLVSCRFQLIPQPSRSSHGVDQEPQRAKSRFLSEKGLDALCKSASRLDRKTRRNGRYRIASATEAAQTQYLAPRKVAATFGTSSASSPQRLIYPVKNCPTIEQCLGHSVRSFKELAEKLRAGECHQDWSTVRDHGIKMRFKVTTCKHQGFLQTARL